MEWDTEPPGREIVQRGADGGRWFDVTAFAPENGPRFGIGSAIGGITRLDTVRDALSEGTRARPAA